jgi:hypothetical protein
MINEAEKKYSGLRLDARLKAEPVMRERQNVIAPGDNPASVQPLMNSCLDVPKPALK